MAKANVTGRRFWLAGRREPAQDVFFKEALDPSRWQPGDERDWESCWYTGMPAPGVFAQLKPGQSVNHIPGNSALTVKSSLYATLAAARERMVEQWGADSEWARRLSFFPRTYVMPAEYHALQEAAAAQPAKRWILKPKNSARGKGIEVVQDIATIPLGQRWMVQEYLDDPHTIEGRKYVLRLYVLISSVEPLRVYLYEEGSAKLASAAYDLSDLGNRYAHLTNPDVNANNSESESPVVFMSHNRYRSWLREQGHDDEALFARIRDMVTLTVIAAREKMRSRCRDVSADTSGCYELLGVDCLVDSKLKPWILECNLSPSLDICAAPKDGGDVEARMKRQLVADTVSLLGLNEPWLDRSALPPDERIRAETQAERSRAGGFRSLFPASDVERYLPFFPLPRLADMRLADEAAGRALARPTLSPSNTAELVGDNGLNLYAQSTATLYAPNATAAWIWLKASDGANPDRIADELVAAQPQLGEDRQAAWAVSEQVWDVLADWAGAGLLRQGAEGRAPHDASPQASEEPQAMSLRVGEASLRLYPGDVPAARRLRAPFSPLALAEDEGEPLRILRAASGYAIAVGNTLYGDAQPLGRLAPVLCQLFLQRSIGDAKGCAIAGVLVPLSAEEDASGRKPAVFLPQDAGDGCDLLALSLAARCGLGHAGGLRFVSADAVNAVGLPARLAPAEADRLAAAAKGDIAPAALTHLHDWAARGRGYLLPATPVLLGQDCRIRAIVVSTRPGRASAPSLKRLDMHEALAALLPVAAARGGGSLSAAAVTELAEWLVTLDLWSLDAADPQAGVDALLEALTTRSPEPVIARADGG